MKLIVTLETVNADEEKNLEAALQSKDDFVQTLSRVVQQVQHEQLTDGKTIEVRDNNNQPVGTVEVVGKLEA